MKKLFLLLIFITISLESSAQVEFSGKVSGSGFYSNSEELPFWFYSNQRGRISDSTDFSGLVSAKLNYDLSEISSLEVGGGFLYDDKFSDEVVIDELYVEFNWKWLKAIAGRKQRKELYNGLSATNENFAWSLNARPLPGIALSTVKPLFFNQNKKLGVEITWAEYFMGDDRFVKNARLHSKSLFLMYNPSTSFKLKGGISHYAQWGGNSPVLGQQPESFGEYLRVITGRSGGEEANMSDQINVSGSQLGVYIFELKKSTDNYSLKLIYNHFFEDGSGSRYANFPDGRYAVYFEKKEANSLLNALLYEFYYTKNQSQNSSSPHKNDFYFWNGIYRSGWTYQNRILGVPFFDFDSSLPQIVGNKFIAHHIGISGSVDVLSKAVPYKLKLSFVQKEGTLSKAYSPSRQEFYGNYEIRLLQSFIDLDLRLGTEFSNVANPIFGAGVNISKEF